MPREIVVLVTGDPVETVAEERGNFVDLIAKALGPAWTGGLRGVDVRSPAAGNDWRLEEAAALIITGSSANVHTREPWMLASEAALRERVAAQQPVFGICFGHQLLAQALGGDVQANPRGREMSTVSIERLDSDPLLDVLPASFEANACHSDTVVTLPSGARVLAQSQADPHQCLRFAERCYGVQFHPEFDRFVMRAYVDARREAMHAEGHDADAALERARDTPLATGLLRRFVETMVS